MKELIESKKWLVMKTSVLMAGSVLFLILELPMAFQLADSWGEARARQRKVQEARSYGEVTRILREQNSKRQALLAALHDKIPQDEVLSTIILFLQKAARESRLQLQYLKPQEPVTFANHLEIPLELALTGHFHELSRFLFLLESSRNVVRVRSLKMSTEDMVAAKLDIVLHLSIFLMRPS